MNTKLNTPYFYILFEYSDRNAFDQFCKLFVQLQSYKNEMHTLNERDEDDETEYIEKRPAAIDWQSYLTPFAQKWFDNSFNFQSDEGQTYTRLWELTHSSIRNRDPFFILPGNWHLESVIEAILYCDYTLLSIEKLENSRAVLYYDPWGAPFGGAESLWQLIWAFDNEIIYDFYFSGKPSLTESTWNYDVAKRLVEQNKGLRDT